MKRAKRMKRGSKWIQKTHLKHGALHRELGIPTGEKIPLHILQQAAREPGKLGHRARLALTLRKLPRHHGPRK
jgi:hypothetical protein